MKRWYNCWLFHRWSNWSTPNDIGWSYYRQQRSCSVCGLNESRTVLK